MKLYAIVNQDTNCVELDSSSLDRAKQYCEELFKERPPGTVLHIYKYMLSAEKPSVVFRTNGVCKRTTVKRQRQQKQATIRGGNRGPKYSSGEDQVLRKLLDTWPNAHLTKLADTALHDHMESLRPCRTRSSIISRLGKLRRAQQ